MDVGKEYSVVRARMMNSKDWDATGIANDVSRRLFDNGDGEAAAVIDALLILVEIRLKKEKASGQ